MKKLIGISLAILCATAVSFAQDRIPADSVFAKYYQATGGKSLWDGVKTYNVKRNYTSASATPYSANISGSLSENSIYKSKTIMNRSFIYAVKGAEGWIKVPMGNRVDVKDLSQADKDNMNFELYENLVPFINYQSRGLIATTVGTETVNGVATNNVEIQGKGVKYNLYFDANSGLLVRQKESLAGIETVTDFSNYTKSAFGLLYPSKLVEVNSADKKPITITSVVTINEAVSPELFKR